MIGIFRAKRLEKMILERLATMANDGAMKIKTCWNNYIGIAPHLKEIAKMLGRGQNGVRMTLINLGLMDEGEAG
jgi:hypothetical protein